MIRLFIIIFLVLPGITGIKCNAQCGNASWIHNELWQDSDGGPIIGPLYSIKYYFSEDGRFYGSSTLRSKKSFGFIDEAYSGKYEYEPTDCRVTLFIETDKGDSIASVNIESVQEKTIKLNFNKTQNGSEWYRSKSECTFAMKSNPVLLHVSSITANLTVSDCYDFEKAGLDRVENKEIINILSNASYVGRALKRGFQEEKTIEADYIFSVNYGDALIFLSKNKAQIQVNAHDWITSSSLLYNVGASDLSRLIEIAEKQTQK